MPANEICRILAVSGICVWPNFLSAEELGDTRRDLEGILDQGAFHRAGTGLGISSSVKELRRDDIHWLDREATSAAQNGLWQKIDALQKALNRNLFLGIQGFEGHYACYPSGGFYRRHLDSFRNDDSRVVSLVLFLNQDWHPEHGGQLRIYENDSHRDIAPTGGTMVCFFSRESEHEVLESYQERSTFAGWFKAQKSLS